MLHSKSLAAVFVLFLFFFISSCNKNENTVNPVDNNTSVIFPLKVGNQWNYIDSTFDENNSLVKVSSSSLRITGSTNITYNGKSLEVFYWNWIDVANNKPGDIKWLIRNETDGLYFYGGRYLDSNFVFKKTLSEKYPVNVGDTWNNITYSFSTTNSSFEISDTSLFTCIYVNKKFKTPIGELDSYVYNYQKTIDNEINDIYLYFSKDVGYIGFESKINGILRRKKTLNSLGLLKTSPKNNSTAINDTRESQSAYDVR
ncbi:MAG TPA: hypothetical protein ENI76_08645 [Ignavibacteria bacterium]|nr:hypothetical protein [Ignavibacteria bacterium]